MDHHGHVVEIACAHSLLVQHEGVARFRVLRILAPDSVPHSASGLRHSRHMGELKYSYLTELVPNCLISSGCAFEAPGAAYRQVVVSAGQGFYQSTVLKPRH